MEDVRKQRGIKLVTTEKRRGHLQLEQNFYEKLFPGNLLQLK